MFAFNVNGSMVDIRCDEEERTNTFRLMPNADSTAHYDCMEEIDLGNGGEAILEKRHYCKNRNNKRYVGSNHIRAMNSCSEGRGGALLHPLHNQRPSSSSYAHPSTRTLLEKNNKDNENEYSEDEALLPTA